MGSKDQNFVLLISNLTESCPDCFQSRDLTISQPCHYPSMLVLSVVGSLTQQLAETNPIYEGTVLNATSVIGDTALQSKESQYKYGLQN